MKSATLLILFLLVASMAWAQDNEAKKDDRKKIRVTGGEKTDLILTRTVLPGAVDSVPFDVSRSGSYSLGVGYGLPIKKLMEIKVEPRVLWHKLYFRPTDAKWFPTSGKDSTLIYEKQRVFYAELPVGLKFKMARNFEDKYKLLFEAGFSFGLQISSSAKVRRDAMPDGSGGNNAKATFKINRIEELNAYRYGPYARFGTNWASFYAFYRMSEIFSPYKRFQMPTGESRPYPSFPKIEFGVSVTI